MGPDLELLEELQQLLNDKADHLDFDAMKGVAEAINAALQGDMKPVHAALAMLRKTEETPGRRAITELFRHEQVGPDFAKELAQLRLTNSEAQQILAETSLHPSQSEIDRQVNQALTADPSSVELLIRKGFRASTADKRTEFFHQAAQAAASQPSEIVADVMPGLRLRIASILIQSGRLADAAEITLPALNDAPEDPEGARYALVDMLLQVGWDDELQQVIDRYPEETVGPLGFAAAILEFKRNGASDEAARMLREAEWGTPGTAAYLVGATPMAQNPDAFRDQPLDAAHLLLPGLRNIEGAIPWIRETLADEVMASSSQTAFGDRMDEEDENMNLGKAFDLALEMDCEPFDWKLTVQKISEPEPASVVLFIQDDQPIHATLCQPRPSIAELRGAMLLAITNPLVGQPRKPSRLLIATKADQKRLAKHAGTIGIACEHQKRSPIERSMEKQFASLIASSLDPSHDADGSSDAGSTIAGDQPTKWTWSDLNDAVATVDATDETWLLGIFQPPIYIFDRATPWRSWLGLMVDAESGMILQTITCKSAPKPETVLQLISDSVQQPAMGTSRRPARILIDPTTPVDFEGAGGIDCPWIDIESGHPSLSDHFTMIVADLLAHQSAIKTPLQSLDGIDEEFLADLYRTAAAFYRKRPWRLIGGDHLFDITCESWPTPAWAGVVMGQLGQQLGLNVFDNPAAARHSIRHPGDTSGFNGVAIQFDEAHEGNPADVWYQERKGWEIAGSEAVPFIVRMEAGQRFVVPTAEDLRVLRIAMLHTPRFLDHPADQPFEVNDGADQIRFEWVRTL